MYSNLLEVGPVGRSLTMLMQRLLVRASFPGLPRLESLTLGRGMTKTKQVQITRL
jgi:hypothetical protein